MDDVKLKLNDFLKDCSKLLILGIGNDIRGDDGLGPYIINQLFNLKEDLLENNDCSETNLYEFINLDKLNNLKNSTNFKNLVLINKSETSMDNRANLVIHDSIGKVFSQIKL